MDQEIYMTEYSVTQAENVSEACFLVDAELWAYSSINLVKPGHSSALTNLFLDYSLVQIPMTTKSTASSTRIAQAVAETQGLLWLLDDVLQAQDDLLALLAKPSGLPMKKRDRLLIFCDRVSTTCKEAASDSLASMDQQCIG